MRSRGEYECSALGKFELTETTIVNSIMRYLKPLGFVMKLHGSPMQMAGVPDILFIRDGRTYWFEVKQPGRQLGKLQAYRIKELLHHGCWAGMVHGKADVKRIVENGRQGNAT